jgi:phosphopantothenoylcysteine decarboxylase/phosphopantothenate--cysteine ligase
MVMKKKRIVLGIGGGIACYKIADLASKLTQNGLDVHAVLTDSATKFIAPLTFTALTHNRAYSSLWDENPEGEKAGMPHIELADGADLILIAPATADLIARLAAGVADDLITNIVLATKAKIAVAPAMNPQMLSHPATARNIETLRSFGYRIIEPNSGRMACEHVGTGRLPETLELLGSIEQILNESALPQDLAGKRVLITAGPTRENLDPVRYISNRSSGKMGYALAKNAVQRGAKVTLVSGPTSLETPENVHKLSVQTALEMYEVTLREFQKADILIACAAPADFRAKTAQAQKIKRENKEEVTLELVANPDIVAACGSLKRKGQLVIGFAAETNDVLENAEKKLDSKKLDAIVANDVTQSGTGFDSDFNHCIFVTPQSQIEWPRASKIEIASQIFDAVLALK